MSDNLDKNQNAMNYQNHNNQEVNGNNFSSPNVNRNDGDFDKGFSQVFHSNLTGNGQHGMKQGGNNFDNYGGQGSNQRGGNYGPQANLNMSFRPQDSQGRQGPGPLKPEPKRYTNQLGQLCAMNGAPVKINEDTFKELKTLDLRHWPSALPQVNYSHYLNACYEKVVSVRERNNEGGYSKRNPMTLVKYIYPHKEVHSYDNTTIDEVKFVTLYFESGYDAALVGRWFAENDDILMRKQCGLSKTPDMNTFWHPMHLNEDGSFNNRTFTVLFDKRVGYTEPSKVEHLIKFEIDTERENKDKVNRLKQAQDEMSNLFNRFYDD